MAGQKITRVLPYRVEDLFDIAADVHSYAEFLPLCTHSKFTETGTDGTGVRKGIGVISIRKEKYGIDHSFSSDVLVDRGNFTVISTSSEAPIKSLHSQWKFFALASGHTQVEYEIDFSFRNIALQLLAKKFFGLVTERIIAAFEARAAEKYERIS